jgi:hypothetical protein
MAGLNGCNSKSAVVHLEPSAVGTAIIKTNATAVKTAIIRAAFLLRGKVFSIGVSKARFSMKIFLLLKKLIKFTFARKIPGFFVYLLKL